MRGNEALQRGTQLKRTFFLREALSAYSDAISAKPQDSKLLAILHSNRAQAHLVLGNNRSALDDSTSALRHDPGLLKVHAGLPT